MLRHEDRLALVIDSAPLVGSLSRAKHLKSFEEGLGGRVKSRLSSQIWTLALLTGAGFLLVVGLAASAGRAAKDGTLFDAIATPTGAAAIVVAIAVTILLAWRLGSAILSPVSELAAFSERLAAGDSKARADVGRTTSLATLRKI